MPIMDHLIVPEAHYQDGKDEILHPRHYEGQLDIGDEIMEIVDFCMPCLFILVHRHIRNFKAANHDWEARAPWLDIMGYKAY